MHFFAKKGAGYNFCTLLLYQINYIFLNLMTLTKKVMQLSMRCRLCEHPMCTMGEKTDIRGIMRRVAVGNFSGAWKCWLKAPVDEFALAQFEDACICANEDEGPVAMREIIGYLSEVNS